MHSQTLSAKQLLLCEIQLAKLDFFGNDPVERANRIRHLHGASVCLM